MDCIDACRQGAVGYRFRFAKTGAKPAVAFEAVGDTRKPDTARRSFLTGLGLLAASAAVRAQEKKVDGGLAVILDKKIPDRATPVVPPGARSLRNMAAHCTGCQLCVSVCPDGVSAASGKPCDSAEHARFGYGKGTGGTAGYCGVVHRIPGELAARGTGGV